MPSPKRKSWETQTLQPPPSDTPDCDRIHILGSIEDVSPGEWNSLDSGDNPFLRHEFLAALETSGSACEATGWQPRHLVLRRGDRLTAAMPLYAKSHSWGEFVFDHAWAEAFHRAGRSYYPKLVCCIPFTPVTGPRLLVGQDRPDQSRDALIQAAIDLCAGIEASSLHLLFPNDEDVRRLRPRELMIRKDCQYHWHNRGYSSFSDFLAGFRSARRKKLLRERRRVAEAGISFRVVGGAELDDAMLDQIFRMHAITFLRRGQTPYLNRDCFRMMRDSMAAAIVVVLAERRDKAIACAVSFRSHDSLYGRYWGCEEYHDSLHFETCFYQGIEYCIDAGLKRFEPGAQGEHKLRRGFDPSVTWSAHWVSNAAFATAIGEYLDQERDWVDRYVIDARDQLPFHRDSADSEEDKS
ncbi:MAG: N-acetyltransferase [Gammaproteobacteria bacterium]|nr:MAG: N-acetyltransferase [Gammaproteobacteria bacterium]